MRLFILLLALWLPAAHADTPPPAVLVTIKPLHALVSMLLHNISAPALLIQGYVSPHTFQLRPSDMRQLTQADVIIWVGPALETNLQKTLKNATRQTVIQLTEPQHAGNAPHHWHDDPHRWLDPLLMQQDMGRIAATLRRLYPEHAQRLDANHQQAVARLQQLHDEISQTLAGQKKISAVLYHDAWQHFQNRYRITADGVINTTPHRQPGARHLADIINIMHAQQTKCLLIEPQFRPKYVRNLQQKTQAHVVTLDPLASAATPGVDSYFQMMRDIAQTFSNCR